MFLIHVGAKGPRPTMVVREGPNTSIGQYACEAQTFFWVPPNLEKLMYRWSKIIIVSINLYITHNLRVINYFHKLKNLYIYILVKTINI